MKLLEFAQAFLFAKAQLNRIEGKLIQMALKLDLLQTSVNRIITEVGETFDAVNAVLATLRANQQDPAQQALIDETVAKIDAQATSLDEFQASLTPAPPTP